MESGHKYESGIDLGSFKYSCFKESKAITAHPDSRYEIVTNDIGGKSFSFVFMPYLMV